MAGRHADGPARLDRFRRRQVPERAPTHLISANMACSDRATGSASGSPSRCELKMAGISMMLPTAYDYATETETRTLERLSLTPPAAKSMPRSSYTTALGRGWLGANLMRVASQAISPRPTPTWARQSATVSASDRLTARRPERPGSACRPCAVLDILVAEQVDQVALLVADRDQHVDRQARR